MPKESLCYAINWRQIFIAAAEQSHVCLMSVRIRHTRQVPRFRKKRNILNKVPWIKPFWIDLNTLCWQGIQLDLAIYAPNCRNNALKLTKAILLPLQLFYNILHFFGRFLHRSTFKGIMTIKKHIHTIIVANTIWQHLFVFFSVVAVFFFLFLMFSILFVVVVRCIPHILFYHCIWYVKFVNSMCFICFEHVRVFESVLPFFSQLSCFVRPKMAYIWNCQHILMLLVSKQANNDFYVWNVLHMKNV